MTQTNTQSPGYPALLTLLQADLYAREVVAEAGPHFTYTMRNAARVIDPTECVYVWDGKPDCIVARILHRHGVPVEVLKRWENIAVGDMYPSDGRFTAPKRDQAGHALVTEDAAHFLTSLQLMQDGGMEWGVALEGAFQDHARTVLARALRVGTRQMGEV